MVCVKEEVEWEVFSEHPEIRVFLEEKVARYAERLESTWRKENLVLRVVCEGGCFVYKRISGSDKVDEIERVKILRAEYPSLTPKLHICEGNAYLMDYVEGKNFFGLEASERVERIARCGQIFRDSWVTNGCVRKDISDKVKNLFLKYRKKSARFFSDDELWLTDFSAFGEVPDKPSHNDMNAANVLYDEAIKLIDPSDEGYNDIARDVGRYCASTFFNNYDYFGNNRIHSLDIAHAFLGNFDSETLERARFYMGESFLAFLNFPTISTPKEVLKKLAINVLTRKDVMAALEESI